MLVGLELVADRSTIDSVLATSDALYFVLLTTLQAKKYFFYCPEIQRNANIVAFKLYHLSINVFAGNIKSMT